MITTKALLLYRPGEACGLLESIFQPIVQACGSFLYSTSFKVWISKFECSIYNPFPKKFFGTIGFQLGDGIKCLEPEAQNTA